MKINSKINMENDSLDEETKEDFKSYEFTPLVEVLKYSEVKHGDVLILRCESGKENEQILKMHSTLRQLINEKDLRILAVNPKQSFEDIFLSIEAAKNFKEEYMAE